MCFRVCIKFEFSLGFAEKDVDIHDEWWEEVNIVPQRTAMYDDVFVNQEIVKDYAVGCTGKLKTEYDELIAR